MWIRRVLLSLLLAGSCSIVVADDKDAEKDKPSAPTAVSFFRDIRPIFQEHCHGCHQPAKRGGDYVMTDYKPLAKGGESGEVAVTAGKPDESYLIDQITPEGDSAAMPKGKKPLAETQRKLIRRWIAEGAKDDTPASARPRFDMEHPPTYVAAGVITSLDYSPDGKLLAISGYHEVVVHHADGSGVAARLVGQSERIETVSFSPDGKRIAVAGGNPGRMGEIQVWDVAEKKLLLAKTQGYDTLYGGSWSHDGKLVGFGCPDNTIRAVDAATGDEVLFSGAHSDWVLDTVFSVKSDHLVSVSRDQSMKLINVPTQRFVDNITSITPGALKGGLHAVDRHPSKDEVLTGGADGVPKIYRMYREKARKIGDDFNLVRAFPKMSGRIFDVRFSRDGSKVAAASSFNGKGEFRIFQTSDGKELAKTEISKGGLFSVALSHDGKQAAVGGFDGYVRILNAADGSVVRTFTPIEITKTVAQLGAP